MKIAIVNKSEINDCFSALQYTDSCHLCDKIFSCRVKSKFHLKGIKLSETLLKSKIIEENKNRLKKVEETVKNTLKLLQE